MPACVASSSSSLGADSQMPSDSAESAAVRPCARKAPATTLALMERTSVNGRNMPAKAALGAASVMLASNRQGLKLDLDTSGARPCVVCSGPLTWTHSFDCASQA